MPTGDQAARQSWRPWAALLLLVLAYFIEDPVERALYNPIKYVADLHMVHDGVMSPLPYGVLMMVRLAWNLCLLATSTTLLGIPVFGFPLREKKLARNLFIGLITGLLVMVLAIGAIFISGDATIAPAHQSMTAAATHGASWLAFDLIGAAGEELYGRATILLVAQRLLGWRGAIFVSGLMFSLIHLHNPGVSNIWLFRLFLQGMLLAYAVYRSGSIWWSIAYHAGWNWASAPLFGAAGSGYLDEGHLFDFSAHGSDWITGGAVGPEGSIFAFVAVLAAFGLLILSFRARKSESTYNSTKVLHDT